MRRSFHQGISLFAGLALMLGSAACEKKSGEAVVIGKEHIDAVKSVETPEGGQDTNQDKSNTDLNEQVATVNSRATHNEQWIVDVETIDGGRKIGVRVDQPQFEKIKIGDRVNVIYRQGKHTGTVWGAEIR
jgi:hypothetical protein